MIDNLDIKIDIILSRCRNANRLRAEYGSEEQKAADSLFWRDINALNAEAGIGMLPGKHIRFSVGDGYAHYILKKIGRTTCWLVHIPYGDAYRSNLVGGSGEINTDELEPRIEFEEGIKKLFELKQQTRERAELRRMTVAAE